MIEQERVQKLNNLPINKKGNFISYWMQSSQRVEYNYALELAIKHANELQKPLIVFFGLTKNFPESNGRHMYFLLEGLKDAEKALKERGIKFIVRNTSPEIGVEKIAKESVLMVVDRGYLKIEKKWRRYVMGKIDCPLIQVETNVVVPVEETSNKEEYAAATIRPKITKKIDKYLHGYSTASLEKKSLEYSFDSVDLSNIDDAFKKLVVNQDVKVVKTFKGGTNNAKILLEKFIQEKLMNYPLNKNKPNLIGLSDMSPYLHFGQISPIYIALKISNRKNPAAQIYLEELIVRRELSMNFVFYNEQYDNFQGALPSWAKNSLLSHEKDLREYVYSREELEKGKTHDPFWNAAQNEMLLTGKMHGYMRMYWGKKILEWSKNPEEAYETVLYLNNKYELDGRDPNGYTGVAWCFGKHDRPWKERKIFGKIRYMNAEGLKRKFDIEAYVQRIKQLEF